MRLAAYVGGRDNNFNLIRLVAAFAVLVSHSYPLTGAAASEPFRSLSLGMTLGEFAVNIFFVTSGFLVFASLKRSDNVGEFAAARAVRIFPGLLAMLVFVVGVLGPVLSSLSLIDYLVHPETRAYAWTNATLLPTIVLTGHDWLPGLFTENPFRNAVNGSLWTLPIEVVLYLGLAGLWVFSWAARGRRSALFMLSVLGVGAGLLAVALLVHFKTGAWYGKVADMGYMFFCGAGLYVLRARVDLSARGAGFALAALLFSAWFHQDLFYLACLLLLPYLLLYVAYVPAGRIRAINRLGDYSYGIYIYAFPLQQAVATLVPGVAPWQMTVLAGSATVACAVLSWHLVEQRGLAFRRRERTIGGIAA